MPFDVVVVGNAGVDTNVYLAGKEIDFNVEANFSENLDAVGQSGGYASRGYARLGRNTAFFGTVGSDHCGTQVLEAFTKDGIDISGVWIDPAGTSRSVNIMYPDGRRKNFYDGKSHMTLQAEPPCFEKLISGSTLAHFSIPNWARALLPVAKQAGALIAVDIQDIVNVEDPYRQDFIRAADFLFFSGVNHPDPSPLMREFVKINPHVIMICGMGSDGCALGYNNETRFFPPVAMKAPVVDTNGAGDGLAVGFLNSYVFEGKSLDESIRLGQIVARYTCTLRGSSENLIDRKILERLSHEQN